MTEMVDLSKDDWPDDGPELVRQQSWPVDGTAELELSVDVGRTIRRGATTRTGASPQPTGSVA